MGVSLWAYAQRNAHKDTPKKFSHILLINAKCYTHFTLSII
ncbi:MAG: hypothetical protein NZ455_06800 [Bacteroidia bacterium]|nr:hypothetical protein [Bacteroidia bacterium]MDW8345536.1 hypothetical protein [Bacteroidia bacterium]